MTRSFSAVRQVRRPQGEPRREDFEFVTEPLTGPGDGQVLVENIYLSVDPYMRELMDSGDWAKGAGLEGRALGRVIESKAAALPIGTIVFHRHGWCTHAVLGEADVRVVTPVDGVPLSAFLGVLGGTGLTAYVGLTRVARLQPGEDLFVSAAAGAVGSAAGQIARLLHAGRVIGSAGSAAKVEHLTTRLGFDAAFDHRDGPIRASLAKAAPEGIDVYFDNVGGDHLAAAIDVLRQHGRIAWCGAVAQYNNLDDPPAAPHNLFVIVGKAIRLEGFLVRDHGDAREEFERFLVPHVRSGRITVDETVADGFPTIVDAFLGMLRGENIGRTLVRVTPE
ncbi:NADP-dependent oxidoreductase [Kibdelosporangium phytohabitans]|uniref:NADP-dependent oxidoreductase n=1 Tax=Kibdelosporangium phytohabitans TaxID=860235 RepID=A0A0N9I2G5_9PSEU|nr:NADP-dependent oxidoreductase [Kibdelosporangium phytohabitans]ALG08910.1 NADP-dependent oxidoreductase [Kibdelosporangium phytohabitans]MBE1469932.1 NADPH-dependent curcumin reductase CurA [Kibdelosporangium phytohabitans]